MEKRNKKRVKYTFLILLTILIITPIILYSQNSVSGKNTSQNKTSVQENKNKDVNSTEAKGNEAPAYQYKAPNFQTSKVSYPMLILRTVAVLAIIVVSIFVLFRILVKNKNKIISDSEIIKVMATFPLAANRVIQIVDIGGKFLVLGVTDSNINLITTIEDKEVIDNIRLFYSKEKAQKTGFKDQFLKILGGKMFSKTGQISYLDSYKKRIKKMKNM